MTRSSGCYLRGLSLEAEAARLLEDLDAAPDDVERWVVLGRWCARVGTVHACA